jgi:hypothetical protein
MRGKKKEKKEKNKTHKIKLLYLNLYNLKYLIIFTQEIILKTKNKSIQLN